jgi:hypothetical protein
MNRSLSLVLALLCVSVAAWAAPGEVLRTNSVTLRWDAADPLELIDTYRLYYRTNLPFGMPVTNAPPGEVMDWTPVETNGWELYATIPGTTNQVTVPRLPGVTAMFFVLTASNRLGESPFSNVAWTPPPPNHRDKNLRITAEQ